MRRTGGSPDEANLGLSGGYIRSYESPRMGLCASKF